VNILGNQSRLAELAKHNRQIRQKVLSTLEMPMYTGATPVLIACQKGFFDIAALLLSQGVGMFLFYRFDTSFVDFSLEFCYRS
jgi:ankyrin repeat protein